MTIKEVLALKSGQRAKLSRAELARAVSVLASAGNKRLRRIEKEKLTKASNAYQAIARSGGDFSVKNKDVTELEQEFQRLFDFFEKSKTSTVAGTRKSEATRKAAVNEWMNTNGMGDYNKWSKKRQNEFWDFVHSEQTQKAVQQFYGNYTGSDSIFVAYQEFMKAEKHVKDFAKQLRINIPGKQNAALRRQMIAMERETALNNAKAGIFQVFQQAYEAAAELEAEDEENLEAYMEARYSTVE